MKDTIAARRTVMAATTMPTDQDAGVPAGAGIKVKPSKPHVLVSETWNQAASGFAVSPRAAAAAEEAKEDVSAEDHVEAEAAPMPHPGPGPYPLHQTWSFWYDHAVASNLSAAEYESSLRHLCDVSTIEQFWQVMNNLPRLAPRATYHMMQAGIRPLWEDPANARGGSATLKVRKGSSEQVWQDLAMAVVGETLIDHMAASDDVCGISFSVKQGAENVVRLWNKNAEGSNGPQVLRAIQTHVLAPSARVKKVFYDRHKIAGHHHHHHHHGHHHRSNSTVSSFSSGSSTGSSHRSMSRQSSMVSSFSTQSGRSVRSGWSRD